MPFSSIDFCLIIKELNIKAGYICIINLNWILDGCIKNFLWKLKITTSNNQHLTLYLYTFVFITVFKLIGKNASKVGKNCQIRAINHVCNVCNFGHVDLFLSLVLLAVRMTGHILKHN